MIRFQHLGREHIDTVYEQYNSDELKPLICNKDHIDKKEIESFILPQNGCWLAVYKEDEFAGVAGIHHITSKEAEISITLFPKYQGQGIGKIIFNKLSLLAREVYEVERFVTKVVKSNINSVKFHNALNFELVNEENGYLTFSFDLYKKRVPPNELLTVVIPTYNSEKTIKRALDSLSDFPQNNIEIIVIDDGSTDTTVQIVSSYQNVVLIKNEKNMLPGYSRNIGIKQAKGDFIYFLDSDDCAISYWLYKMFVFATVIDTDIIYTNKYLTQDDRCIRYVNYSYSGMIDEEQQKLLLRSQFIIWTSIYKKSFLTEKEILFYENSIYEDNCFSFYVAINAKYVTYFDKIITIHYNTPNSLSKTRSIHLFDNIDMAHTIYKKITEQDIYPKLKDELDLWYYYFEYVQTLRSCMIIDNREMLKTAHNNLKLISGNILDNKYIRQHTNEQIFGIKIGMESCEEHFKFIKENEGARL